MTAVGAHTSQQHDHEHHTVFLFPICLYFPLFFHCLHRATAQQRAARISRALNRRLTPSAKRGQCRFSNGDGSGARTREHEATDDHSLQLWTLYLVQCGS